MIILILGSAIGGAISIRLASDKVDERVRSKMGPALTIGYDHEKINQDRKENPEAPITWQLPDTDVLEGIGKSQYVKYYEYSLRTSVGSKEMKPYIPAYFQNEANEEKKDKPGDNIHPFSLNGVSRSSFIDMEEGKSSLISGRLFTEEEMIAGAPVVLISKKLADLNQIRVGDSLSFQASVFDFSQSDSEKEFFPILQTLETAAEVIGLYETHLQEATTDSRGNVIEDPWGHAFQDQTTANTLIAPQQFVSNFDKLHVQTYAEIYKDKPEHQRRAEEYQSLFILKDPADLESFITENEVLLPPYNRFVSSLDNYKLIAGPLEQAKKLSEYTLIVTVAAAVLIISLVVVLSLRDRKHELGIYLSLGEKKSLVIRQILLETLLIAVLGIALSVFTGQMLAGLLSTKMVQNELDQTGKESAAGWIVYDKGISATYMNVDFSIKDIQDAYGIRLSPGYIAVYSLIALGIILLASLAPMCYILRLNPKKILMGL